MSERTPEERERARWERAAKRAADRGEPPPPLPPELGGAADAPERRGEPPQRPAPAAGAPADRPDEPPAGETAPQQPHSPPPPDTSPAAPEQPAEQPSPADATPAQPRPHERAAGETQEWSVTEEWAAEAAAEVAEPEPFAEPEPYEEPHGDHGEPYDPRDAPYDPRAEVAPPEPPPPFEQRRAAPKRGRSSAAQRRAAAAGYLGGGARGGGNRPRRGRLAAVAIVSGLVLVVAAWFLMSLFQPLKGDGTGEVAVTIPEGSGTAEIADILEREGVVSSATFFRLRASLSGDGGDFKAGDFTLREDMSYAAAIDALVQAPVPDTVTVTIPEGLSRREAAATVRQSGVRGDYMAATRAAPRFPLAEYDAQDARNLEGFLFPATYELDPGQRVKALVDQQLAAFQREFAKVDMRYAKSKNLTPYEVVIIASMIDREAMIPRERRLVASVIYNRLNQGIPLGIDATIRFATNNWSEPLKQSELAIDSGYNTRLNQGLPPGPIGNPGLAALRAAANPAETDFIYYVVKPCAEGAHAFSSSDAEFQRDVDRYNAERERQGGQSPTEC
ncbi:MAG: endolytic transglycosylase MltG [Solirubrobacterales bacterium]|nr:endolytic transglycosylase MltG [Solirubrobacterales bacterium]